jgi:hypothetical protein
MCVVHFCISSDSKEILLVIKVPDTVVLFLRDFQAKRSLYLQEAHRFNQSSEKKKLCQ